MIDSSRLSRKRLVVACLLTAVLWLAAPAQDLSAQYWAPDTPSPVVELENALRVFADIDDWDPMIDVTWRFQDDDFSLRYRAVTLGTYYRVHDNVKVGAFYRLQGGVWHDDDWVEIGNTDEWEWEDTNDRYESVLIGDVSPRFQLEMIPGEDWVLMVKNRFIANLSNGDQTYLIRPGLTYFWIEDRDPVLNLTLAYGLYFSLNYGETATYKRALYLSGLYHIDQTWKAELGIARESITWSTSEEVAEASSSWDYTKNYTPWVVSLRAIVMLDF